MTILAIGIDVGTSGVRAVALDAAGRIQAQASSGMVAFGADHRDPRVWWAATEHVLRNLLLTVDGSRVAAIAVDGTSGTVLAVDRSGTPLAPAMMYNDPVDDAPIIHTIGAAAPIASGAHGPTSGLAKLIKLQGTPGIAHVIHQADWISGRFSGCFDLSDENNALKTGYDPIERCWPDWIGRTPARRELLPRVLPPGSVIGPLAARMADAFGLPRRSVVVAGTTDGCASFLATGASQPGEAVTALGSTLTLKLLSERPLFAPEYGVYSHRIGDSWLAGGASNAGGAVLAHYFAPERIVELSSRLDPHRPTGLDFYPLLKAGERFPVSDPHQEPRLAPRPQDDAVYLQAILEGIAAVEALGYTRLAELGGPPVRSVRTVGGGARNTSWSAIRARLLSVPLLPALSEEAAAGTARLALAGLREAGLIQES